MVAHVGEGDARGDALRARRGGKECRLADAIAAAAREHRTRAIGVELVVRHVGIVENLVAHRVIKLDRLGDRLPGAAGGALGKGDDGRMVAVDEATRAEKRVIGLERCGHGNAYCVSRAPAAVGPSTERMSNKRSGASPQARGRHGCLALAPSPGGRRAGTGGNAREGESWVGGRSGAVTIS